MEKGIPEGRVKFSIKGVHMHKSALTITARVIHDDVSKMISSTSTPDLMSTPILAETLAKTNECWNQEQV